MSSAFECNLEQSVNKEIKKSHDSISYERGRQPFLSDTLSLVDLLEARTSRLFGNPPANPPKKPIRRSLTIQDLEEVLGMLDDTDILCDDHDDDVSTLSSPPVDTAFPRLDHTPSWGPKCPSGESSLKDNCCWLAQHQEEDGDEFDYDLLNGGTTTSVWHENADSLLKNVVEPMPKRLSSSESSTSSLLPPKFPRRSVDVVCGGYHTGVVGVVDSLDCFLHNDNKLDDSKDALLVEQERHNSACSQEVQQSSIFPPRLPCRHISTSSEDSQNKGADSNVLRRQCSSNTSAFSNRSISLPTEGLLTADCSTQTTLLLQSISQEDHEGNEAEEVKETKGRLLRSPPQCPQRRESLIC